MEKKQIVQKALAPFRDIGVLTDSEIQKIEDSLTPEKQKSVKTKPMTVKEVCDFLKISRPTFLSLRKKGEIKSVIIAGKSLRFREEDIEDFLCRKEVKTEKEETINPEKSV